MHLQLLPAQLTQIKIDVIGCVRGAMFHQLPIVVWIYRTKHGLVHYEQLQPCLIQLSSRPGWLGMWLHIALLLDGR